MSRISEFLDEFFPVPADGDFSTKTETMDETKKYFDDRMAASVSEAQPKRPRGRPRKHPRPAPEDVVEVVRDLGPPVIRVRDAIACCVITGVTVYLLTKS